MYRMSMTISLEAGKIIDQLSHYQIPMSITSIELYTNVELPYIFNIIERRGPSTAVTLCNLS